MKNAFLDHLAATCNVSAAAEEAGVSPGSVYQRRRRDPAFRAEWGDALLAGYEMLETQLVGHALSGAEAREMTSGDVIRTGAINIDLALKLLSTHRSAMRNALRLGYRGTLVHYVGMSHYFRLSGGVATDAGGVLNVAAAAWHRAFAAEAKLLGYDLVWSLSYELFDAHCPQGWKQRAADGSPALTGCAATGWRRTRWTSRARSPLTPFGKRTCSSGAGTGRGSR